MFKLCLSLIMWLSVTGAARADVNIVSSIKPLALIGQAVIGDRGTVKSLVDARQSAHDYVIRPSDRIAIEQANLLVWVDPAFEVYLADIFTAQSQHKTLLTFSGLQGVSTIHEVTDELDPHMWLNTENALLLATEIARQAAKLDAENAQYFRANLAQFRRNIIQTTTQIHDMFANTMQKSYAVYHNAYHYFENQFNLQHAVVLLKNPESQPGIQETIRVRSNIQKLNPGCLMLELDSNSAVVKTMLNGQEIDQPVIDIMGYDVAADDDGYIVLLNNLAKQFDSCIN